MGRHERNVRTNTESESTDPSAFPDLVQSMAKTDVLVDELRSGPAHKASLAETIGVSKSTVYNWGRELMEHGVVEKTADGYRLTYLGQCHADLYAEWEHIARRMTVADPIVRELPDECRPPVNVFESGDVVTVDADPDAPMNHLLDCIERADSTRGLFPVVGSRLLGELAAVHEDGETNCTLVVPPTSFDSRAASPAGRCRESNEAVPNVEFLEAGTSFTFGLGLFTDEETEVGLCTYSSYGHLTGFLRTTADEALDWARTVYREYERDARRVSVGDGTADASR
jgi:predicted transcriptional regulator